MTVIQATAQIAAGPSVAYTSIEGHQLSLTPWVGEHVALLTPPGMTLDPAIIGRMVGALDQAWEYYQSITGREPTP